LHHGQRLCHSQNESRDTYEDCIYNTCDTTQAHCMMGNASVTHELSDVTHMMIAYHDTGEFDMDNTPDCIMGNASDPLSPFGISAAPPGAADELEALMLHVSPCTATHCNALQRTATHCNALQCTDPHCNILQHTATRCNTLQHAATHCNTLQRTATHCNTLSHAATCSNTLQQLEELMVHVSTCVFCVTYVKESRRTHERVTSHV